MASSISITLSDEALHKLDEMIARQREISQGSEVQADQTMRRSTLINELILQSVMPPKPLDVSQIENAVRVVAKEYGAKSVWLFGSFARGDQRADSDVDLLLDKGDIKGVKVLDFQEVLAKMLGRNVDVVTTAGASDRFLDSMRGEAQLLYEA